MLRKVRKININNQNIESISLFLSSKPFKSYRKNNPNSSEEIKNLLITFYTKNSNLTGIDTLYKSLADNTRGNNPPPLKWFSYFSQIRCLHYLMSKDIKVVALETYKDKKLLDFMLDDGRYGEIKSFSTVEERLNKPYSSDEYVLKYFVEKKLIPAFYKQKADLVVIDNIFAQSSKYYGLLDYFLSFVYQPEIKDRYTLLSTYLGPYLHKILYLSFIRSITVSPSIKYSGNEFIKLGIC